MSLGQYIAGVLLLGTIVCPLAFVARRLQRRMVPDLTAPISLVAWAIVWLALVVGLCELLGVVGLFRRGPLAVASVSVGVAALRIRCPPAAPREAPTRGGSRAWNLAAAGAAALVFVDWAWASAHSVAHGIQESDSLSYHLPFAARFAQDGTVAEFHQMLPGHLLSFHPATAELLHGLGIVALGSDLTSTVLNLGWLALALLSAWCIGRPSGNAAQSMIGAAAVIAATVMRGTNAGSAGNDIVVVALVLAAAALLIDPVASRFPYTLPALAAGLALGTKLSVVTLVGVLFIGAVVLTRRPLRWRVGVVWASALTATGGLWYARNALLTGSPIPAMDLRVGPLALPRPEAAFLDEVSQSVVHYLGDVDVWRRYFLPGLDASLGPGWWFVVGLALGAAVLNVVRSTAADRASAAVAFAALASLVTYVFTPTGAGGPEGEPVFFAANLRYAIPGLALSLALAPGSVAARSGPARAVVGCSVGVAFTVTQLFPRAWGGVPPAPRPKVFLFGLGMVAVCLGASWLARSAADRWGVRRVGGLGALALVITFVLGGWSAQQRYSLGRYDAVPTLGGSYGRQVQDARVGFAGFFTQYVLFGPELSNRVEYVGRPGRNHATFDYTQCSAWRRAVNAGGYEYIVVSAPFSDLELPVQAGWTRNDPAAEEVFASDGTSVFRIHGVLDEAGCPAEAGRS